MDALYHGMEQVFDTALPYALIPKTENVHLAYQKMEIFQ